MIQETFRTCLYYTFSTIAQSLATGLALLATVVLFKLDKLSRALETVLRNIFSGWKDDVAFDLYMKGDWNGIIEIYKASVFYPSSQTLQKNVSDLGKIVKEIPEIRRELLSTVKLTSYIVGASIAVLVSTPILSKCSVLSIVVLVSGIILTALALFRYYKLIERGIQ